jgi:hypothetical protein
MLQPDVWLNEADPDACCETASTLHPAARRSKSSAGLRTVKALDRARVSSRPNHALKLGAPMFQHRGE